MEAFSLRPPRISAFSALNGSSNTENAEIHRGRRKKLRHHESDGRANKDTEGCRWSAGNNHCDQSSNRRDGARARCAYDAESESVRRS